MKPETIIIGLLLMILCSGFVSLFLKAFYEKRFNNALLHKGISSICFVILGGMNFFLSEFSLSRLLLFVGLFLGIIGDEILALCQIYPKKDSLYFIGGGSFFIVGHILYIIAMILMKGPSWVAVAISFVILMALCLVYESKKKFFIGDMRISLILYISTVIFFASVGVGTFLRLGTLGSALLAIGGILFAVSDNILFAFKFSEKPKYIQNIILHVAYYLAQLAIAWSIGLI